MEKPSNVDRDGFSRKFRIGFVAMVLGYAGLLYWQNSNQEHMATAEQTRQKACQVLSIQESGFQSDEDVRKRLCANKLFRKCLARTNVCKGK